MRGEFRRSDGLVIPNNITLAGAGVIMAAAFQAVAPTWFVALVSGSPTLNLVIDDLIEPEIGVNGYARIGLAQDNTDWPVLDVVSNERFVESKDLVWEATGGGFSAPIQRLALLGTETPEGLDDPIYALSAPLPAEIVVTPDTPLEQRTFRYRVYL